MDLITGRFADLSLAGMCGSELLAFEQLLACQDPDIYDWAIGRIDPPEEHRALVTKLKAFYISRD